MLVRAAEQVSGIEPELCRQAFDGPQAQVALTPLHDANEGAVYAELIGEGLLTHPTGVTLRPHPAAHPPLQLAVHGDRR